MPIGIALVVLAMIAAIIFGILAEEKRKEALRDLARGMGLEFSPDRDRVLIRHLSFLDQLREGDDRYACNVSRGDYCGEQVQVFDFHYETSSRDSKGRRTSTSHWHHVLTLQLPRPFPEFTLARENIFTRVAQALGFPAITFESAEFSKTFLVRSRDKRFAYDVCHPRAMEFFLANRDLTIEIESFTYAVIFPGRQKPERFQFELDRLIELRQLMPRYLFDEGVAA